jgi:hypothetical protein
MKRTKFEHAIRAAGSILGTTELIVIGSQAIHAISADLLNESAEGGSAERSVPSLPPA